MTTETMPCEADAALIGDSPCVDGLIHEGLWQTREGEKAEVFFSDDYGYIGRVGGTAVGWFPCGENCDGVRELDIVAKWQDRVDDYEPYRPEHRENLRGRWYRFRQDSGAELMVTDLQVRDGELFVNGWSAVDFLNNCCWLTGEMCGRPKMQNTHTM